MTFFKITKNQETQNWRELNTTKVKVIRYWDSQKGAFKALIKNASAGIEESSRAHSALTEDQILFLSISVRWFTTTCT